MKYEIENINGRCYISRITGEYKDENGDMQPHLLPVATIYKIGAGGSRIEDWEQTANIVLNALNNSDELSIRPTQRAVDGANVCPDCETTSNMYRCESCGCQWSPRN